MHTSNRKIGIHTYMHVKRDLIYYTLNYSSLLHINRYTYIYAQIGIHTSNRYTYIYAYNK